MGCSVSKFTLAGRRRRRQQDEQDNTSDTVKSVDDASTTTTTTTAAPASAPTMGSPQPQPPTIDADVVDAVDAEVSVQDADDGKKEAKPKKVICSVCWDDIVPQFSPVIRPCPQCSKCYCTQCIRQIFTRACIDISEMPPRCCVPLNLGAVIRFLDAEEVERFKFKHEEVRTNAPVYCPVPTCSAFIPYRLFPKGKRVAKSMRQTNDDNVSAAPDDGADATTTDNQTVQESQTSNPAPHVDPETIPCPQCGIAICCDCKVLAHGGVPCTQSHIDLDDGLVALLKTYNIRQCPKCRNGVRRMYGCHEMRCRCGCNFCWRCGMTLDECDDLGCSAIDGGEGSDDEEDEDMYDDEEEGVHNDGGDHVNQEGEPRQDLDAGGHRVWGDTQHFDFGGEVDREIHEPATCQHTWEAVPDRYSNNNAIRDFKDLCEQCWRPVVPHRPPYRDAATLMTTGTISSPTEADNEDLHPADKEEESDDDDGEEPLEDGVVMGYYTCSLCDWLVCKDCLEEV